MPSQSSKPKRHRTLKATLTEDELESFKKAHQPVTQVEALRSLILWFTSQTDVIRAEILGTLPASIRRDVARILLRRMASK